MSNPFFTDDSDFAPAPNRPTSRKPNKWLDEDENVTNSYGGSSYDNLESLEQKKQRSANRQLQGTRRALAALNESESVGIQTAEELVQQGEKLNTAEINLDRINKATIKSQQSINSMKSVFGGLKSWWNGENKKDTTPVEPLGGPPDKPKSNLSNVVDSYSSPNVSHQQESPQSQNSKSNFNKQLDNDLGEMSNGISRLRGLALGLGDEIQKQNDQLDRITDKTDRADVNISRQNKQMNDILKR